MIDLNLKKGDVVSILGAGGKTTLLNYLSNKYSADNSVLMTTTTKIFTPLNYDYLYHDINFLDTESFTLKNSLYVVAPKYKGKLSSLPMADLEGLTKYFDYTFIEADGSRMKPLKGWSENEPVICGNTTITIGVIDLTQIGKPIDEEIVHRVELFCRLTGKKEGDILTIDDCVEIIIKKDGIFKNSKGKKIIFFSKVDLMENLKIIEEIKIKLYEKKFHGEIIAGGIL
ncbi:MULTISPECIES: selenium cofactor biosynthesis protein YqeC [Psychrilyobacter]|uniref:Selenium-dependent hydroxylase accessory protein YqeC n=1 Tax=Psychrilyobacter piezotolerans TaxID=2293438 RepID=A0ABX9KIC4_9FUSO|nr:MULTISPECIES: selenium cofactor biosynthesis protein YqeC [Psychrilyobacter]MCS5421830.1 selenium cofactor biosynthesis protein YqeC [Psychrilyobacter sp. S5]NDI77572.1 putative selenium-dependent hydroxylase accessory protein YqeC [Psychrilyobacter piezotolerans]RDE62918.1 putative selenium-dependent hydroxylase accessory protein YqeC [Psychrilyobacter sp. S5]REI41676.1 putative selenium-dependent hydroxylase accessory protein YqeC [Psychrilyobacter piezotolerans]